MTSQHKECNIKIWQVMAEICHQCSKKSYFPSTLYSNWSIRIMKYHKNSSYSTMAIYGRESYILVVVCDDVKPKVFGTGIVTTCFLTKVCCGWDSNTQPSLCAAIRICSCYVKFLRIYFNQNLVQWCIKESQNRASVGLVGGGGGHDRENFFWLRVCFFPLPNNPLFF